jgi:ribonuclease Y
MNILSLLLENTSLTSLIIGVFSLCVGSVLGYFARQSIAKKQIGTLEQKIQKRISEAEQEAKTLADDAKEKAYNILESAKREQEKRREELSKTESVLLKRENILDRKISQLEEKQQEFREKVEQLKEVKQELGTLREEALKKIEKSAQMPKKEAREELLKEVERESEKEILEKMRNLEEKGREKYDKRAKEILGLVIQKCAISQAHEMTTTSVSLPSEEIKGRIIGKEGRNIRAFEEATGVEVVVDDTPSAVTISAFDPVRRQIAKRALEALIQDGRIQPARIEEVVAKTEQEISSQMQEAGEKAVFETGVIGLNPKLVQLLGRLWFRTSYGQNVLLHSIEVSLLAGALAAEMGANVRIAQKAGLLHDIGKALDWRVQGSHVDIGVKILEKLGEEKEIIDAMKSHHEEYPYESLEAIIVQTADAISGARPGARKDTLEHYLKRLEDLEIIATSFPGVEKAWALQAGRELRVFVKPNEITDLAAKKLAKEIAARVQEELKYPGEIKVTVVRETRVIEFAK